MNTVTGERIAVEYLLAQSGKGDLQSEAQLDEEFGIEEVNEEETTLSHLLAQSGKGDLQSEAQLDEEFGIEEVNEEETIDATVCQSADVNVPDRYNSPLHKLHRHLKCLHT